MSNVDLFKKRLYSLNKIITSHKNPQQEGAFTIQILASKNETKLDLPKIFYLFKYKKYLLEKLEITRFDLRVVVEQLEMLSWVFKMLNKALIVNWKVSLFKARSIPENQLHYKTPSDLRINIRMIHTDQYWVGETILSTETQLLQWVERQH